MDETKCPQCGRRLVQTRVGRQKRFCSDGCRAKWHRGQPGAVTRLRAKSGDKPSPVSRPDLVADLEEIRAALKADIGERGWVVAGKPNPSLEALRRVVGDLARMVPAPDEDEVELAAVLALARAHDGGPS